MSIAMSPRIGSRSNFAQGAAPVTNSKAKRQAKSAAVVPQANPSSPDKFLKIQRKSQLRSAIL